MLVGDDGVAGLPVGAAFQPRGDVVGFQVLLALEKLGKEDFRVGLDGLLEVGVEFGEFGGVDVDGCFPGFAGEVVGGVAGDGEVEADTDGEEEVGVLEGEVGSARATRRRAPRTPAAPAASAAR